MQEVQFEVQGSAADPYRVSFARLSEKVLTAFCTCPAGENGQYCKHRFAILGGDAKAVVSGNSDQVAIVQEWLKGTELEQALLHFRGLEDKAKEIKSALSASKKSLAKIMRGQNEGS
ncbi:SWIM zinc finger family protein [Oceanospirillum beijerinckii]|uniref:SWIM zinc finger family protein n=1 Tax=Oceanospirillum beijerinckii TaxID=64976 RepID=UPI0004222679|nr:SWIM zinc finger family protein [Oceanospirillum beijerinckii]